MIDIEKNTLTELVLKAAEAYRETTAFQIYRDGGVYDQVSYARLGERSRQFAALFQRLGVRPGDRVMILGENRPEWAFAFFGAALAGAAVVPVLIGFTQEQIQTIAAHAGVSAVCCTARTAAKAAAAATAAGAEWARAMAARAGAAGAAGGRAAEAAATGASGAGTTGVSVGAGVSGAVWDEASGASKAGTTGVSVGAGATGTWMSGAGVTREALAAASVATGAGASGPERAGASAAWAAGAAPIIRLDSLEGDLVAVTAAETRGEERYIPLEPEGSHQPGPEGSNQPGGGAREAAPEDLASILYTSGTTGRSKAVMLTHGNLLFTARSSRELMKIYRRDRLLSVIPLAHTYECVLGLLAPLMSGASITYLDRPPSPAVLLPAMQTLRPTALVSVPLFIEKIYRNQIAPALEASPLYKCPLTRPLAIKAAGARLLGEMGGAVRFFGIGGAPLAGDVEAFLRRAGFPYSPGYGLTETSPLVAGTAPYRFTPGSAGRPLKGIQLRFAPPEDEAGPSPRTLQSDSDINSDNDSDGEIQVRGPNVTPGYYRDEALTAAAFTPDGWLKTGDLGFLDRKGCLHVRGRLKALILGPSGENIYPEEIEGILHSSLMVEDALVVPGERGELVALIVLSERAKTAAAALGDILEDLKRMVNARVAAFSRLSRIEALDAPFEKTPTQKIKRFLYQK